MLESAFLGFLGNYPLPAGLMKHADTRRLVPLVNSKMIGVVDGMDGGRNGKKIELEFQHCDEKTSFLSDIDNSRPGIRI